MIRKHLVLSALLMLLASVPLVAQVAQKIGEPLPSPQFPFTFGPIGLTPLMREAGLSEAQMRQFSEIYQANRHSLIDDRAEVEKKEGDLQVLLDAPQVDLAQAEKAVDALLAARNRLSKTTTMMMVRMRQVVTQEQWRKMAELQRRLAAPPAPAAPLPPAAPFPPAMAPARPAGPQPAPAPAPPVRPPETE